MNPVAAFFLGAFGMMILFGLEGLIGNRAVGVLALAYFVVGFATVGTSQMVPTAITATELGLAAGAIVGIFPGVGLRGTLRYDESTPLIWGLLRS